LGPTSEQGIANELACPDELEPNKEDAMRKVLKWLGIILGGLIGLVVLAVVAMNIVASLRINRTYDVQPQMVTIPSDEESIEAGRLLSEIHCEFCHMDDLSGRVILDDPMLGQAVATNITAGEGGTAQTYSDEDWVLAIRHGIDPNGRPLVIMPSASYYFFSDEDLGNLIAYLKSVPPVDNVISAGFKPTPIARVLLVLGMVGEDAIAPEAIDHEAPRPIAPPVGVTADYGKYLVNSFDRCRTCHGKDLTGGDPPHPDSPDGPSLVSGSRSGYWSVEEFIEAMRTGVSPYGDFIDAEWMPWEMVGAMSDDQLTAMFLYLQSLPAPSADGG
jgi:mono/diheme cytochrome c family protein